MRLAIVFLLLLPMTGCAAQGGADLWGAKIAFGSTLADPRISEKLVTIDKKGVQIASDKYAMSEQFAEMIEKTLPQIVEQAVKAAILSTGLGVAGSVVDGAVDEWGSDWDEGAEETLKEIVEEAPTEGVLP